MVLLWTSEFKEREMSLQNGGKAKLISGIVKTWRRMWCSSVMRAPCVQKIAGTKVRMWNSALSDLLNLSRFPFFGPSLSTHHLFWELQVCLLNFQWAGALSSHWNISGTWYISHMCGRWVNEWQVNFVWKGLSWNIMYWF